MPSRALEKSYIRTTFLITNLLDIFLYYTAYVFTLPYGFFYDRNTCRPLTVIASSPNSADCRVQVELFFKAKVREAQYVQVAGAVIFGAMIACLSWNTPLQKAHWSGPALWYAGIILSLTAIVLGAQQTIYIPASIPSTFPLKVITEIEVSEDFAEDFRRHLRCRTGKSEGNGNIEVEQEREGGHPRKSVLFIWQTPLMLFTYSVACFLGGLSSVVLSPLIAEGGGWRDETKSVIIYAVAVAIGFVTFLSTSVGLISGFGQKWRGPSRKGQIGFLIQK